MNKQKIYKIYLLAFLTIICLGCQNRFSDKNKILADNIVSLIDSTIVDYRVLVVPSPTDFNDSLKIKQLKEKAKTTSDSLKPLTVVVHDSFYNISEIESFYQKIKSNSTVPDYKSIIDNYIENPNKGDEQIKLNEFGIQSSKYEILTTVQYQKLYSENEAYKSGIANYSFSNMYFNEKNNFGVFKVDIVYGRLNAYGVIVFIRKKKGNWQVEKIVADWES